ncbi:MULTISPECIES: Gfo/Idh/MocA family oxidoreductase [Streptomyces]|uniref:Gfo/Idh/MocA family protein n=1 Tax=Streptomyces TaxID=1883 RepID=UPI001489B4D6|nr:MULTISPECIES: Gfo/Idh/MocA family oxidoreductase [Streptomyces]
MTAQRPLRLGVMGCAEFALRRMLPAVADSPDIELAAVASRRPGTAREVAARFGGTPVDGYEQLLAVPDLDAVYVPLPNALHAEWVLRALDSGHHVLAEKPLTTRGDLTREAVRRAAERRLALVENFLFVHHPQHARVRALIGDEIGELRQMSAAFAIPPRPAGDIRHRPDLGGGALLDVGVYPLKAAQYFLGTGLHVAGAALRYGSTGVDVEGSVLLRRADGVCAQLSFGMDHAYTSRYELWGTRGRVTVNRAFTPPADHRPEVTVERDGRTRGVGLPAADQCAAAVAAFAAAVRDPATCHEAAAHSLDLARLTDEVRAAAV